MEDAPKIILQAHMGMVYASDLENVTSDNAVVHAIETDDTITPGGKSSLGADNGAGIGMILAICESNVPHGLICALITADEEVGLIGASVLDPEVIDADYLINIDVEEFGVIYYSSAGDFTAEITGDGEMYQLAEGEKAYRLTIGNLTGGHSGVDIDRHRLNAILALGKLSQVLVDEGIPVRLSTIVSGTFENAIPTGGTFEIMLPENLEQKARDLIEGQIASLKTEYPEEAFTYQFDSIDVSPEKALGTTDSEKLLNFLFKLPAGVITRSDTKDSIVQTSLNVGLLKLADGSFTCTLLARSCLSEEHLTSWKQSFAAWQKNSVTVLPYPINTTAGTKTRTVHWFR
ncbi:MAG TPA: aminoacyl-histidine dipeptidase [Clostridiaceae bacterium]|nr:aminoacyl-histidine dipeptidase [Clostridiaceae bacterium]